MIDRGRAEAAHAITARIVLFFHQHIEAAVRRQQADGLAVAEALLRTVAMLVAVLADFQIAGEIDDFTHHGFHRPGFGLPSTEAPMVVELQGSALSPSLPSGAVGPAIGGHCHLRLQDLGLSSLGLSKHGQGQREHGQNTEKTGG